MIDRNLFVNLTPHAIVIRTAEGDVTFPASGQVARVGTIEEGAGDVLGIPAIHRTMGRVEIPLIPEEVYGIVSSMVLDAAKAQQYPLYFLVAPDTGETAIREKEGPRKGQVIAVTRFVTARPNMLAERED